MLKEKKKQRLLRTIFIYLIKLLYFAIYFKTDSLLNLFNYFKTDNFFLNQLEDLFSFNSLRTVN